MSSEDMSVSDKEKLPASEEQKEREEDSSCSQISVAGKKERFLRIASILGVNRLIAEDILSEFTNHRKD